jgi:3-oxoacyl-[acyl-carrier-protein] synthase-3
MFKNALVIGAETLSRFLDFSDRSTCILFGDGAGAVVLSASEEEGGGLQGLEMTTDPDGAYMIWLPSGGSRSPASGQTLARGEHYVRMEGRETYRYATKTMATTALKAIERAGWQPDEIDLFIPHQANVRIIESVAKGLGLPMEKMFVNVDRYGNTSAGSIPIALAEAVDSGRIKIGDKIVLVAFGAGLTSGGIAMEWTADPTCGERAATVETVASVREPVDWSSVDSIPDRLREILKSGPPVPLDDVVPGEPDHAHHEVLA